MEALIGRERVIDTFEEMVSSAVERLDIVQAPPHFQPRERWNELEAAAIACGVQVRVLYMPEVDANEERYLGLLAAGGAGRVSNGLVFKLVLLGGIDAMVAVPDTSGGVEYTVIRITHPDLIAPLQLVFQKEWQRAATGSMTSGEEAADYRKKDVNALRVLFCIGVSQSFFDSPSADIPA
jgi:hypothetical protein